MDRFTAYLLTRRMLRDPANRRRARLAETLMEQLAHFSNRSDECDEWAMMGLLAFLDTEYAASNPGVRGQMAQQAAEADGLSLDLARLLPSLWQDAEDHPQSALLDALRLSTWLAERADLGGVGQALALRCGEGDVEGDHLDRALAGLGLSTAEAEQLVGRATSLVGSRP